ncbi:MAG TPA: hypothetical protein VH796_17490 [Nitrososphaeraceae archaeon]|jgi:hypothetical protein
MKVEPFANDNFEDNLNPLGWLFYADSTIVRIPAFLSQNSPALGLQVGELGILQIVKSGGFEPLEERRRHLLILYMRQCP